MFAETEDVEPDPVGQFDLLQQMPRAFGGVAAAIAGSGIGIDVGEGVKTKFHDGLRIMLSLLHGNRQGG